jgi:hypothetical protein
MAVPSNKDFLIAAQNAQNQSAGGGLKPLLDANGKPVVSLIAADGFYGRADVTTSGQIIVSFGPTAPSLTSPNGPGASPLTRRSPIIKAPKALPTRPRSCLIQAAALIGIKLRRRCFTQRSRLFRATREHRPVLRRVGVETRSKQWRGVGSGFRSKTASSSN